MKKSLRLIALTGILALSVPVVLGITNNAKKADAYSASSLPTTIDLNDSSASTIRSYYSSLSNLSTSERQGTNLLKNLKTILKNGQKYYSYENGTSIWQMYEITDRDWAKSPASSTTYGTYNSSTNKITNYTYGTSASSSKNNPYIHALYINRDVNNQTTAWDNHNQDEWGINREHVWPKAEGFDSAGAGGARGDPMHLMAGNGYSNNIHSNYYYGYVKTSSSYTDCGSKYSNQSGNLRGTSKTVNSGTVFEPQDCDKGDIARAIFYMVARYNYLSGSDSDGIDTNNPNLTLTQNISDWSSSGYTSSSSTQGKLGILTDLLAWHHADPVDEYEIHRNNLLYTNFTNNRNPFIDFPEWADFIWGTAVYNGSTYVSYDSNPTGYATPSTDTINGYNSGGTTVSVTGVSLDKSSTSITVDGAETLEATVAPSNATNKTVTWSSSNTSVATVSNGTVRGVSEGNATITVTTQDGGFTDQCTVTVTASGGGGGGDGTYVKVTSLSDLETGDYVIAADLSSSVKGMSYSFSGGKYGSSDVTVTNSSISKADGDARKFNISVSGSGSTKSASIKDPDANTYIVYSSGTNLGQVDSAYNWTVSSGTKGTFRFTSETSGRGLIFRASSYNVFGGYSTNNVTAGGTEYFDLELFKYTEATTTKSLDSITLDTSDAQTTFNVGDTFNHDDLVVTANYDDGSSDIVTPTDVSTPDMSMAGQKTVTVTYTEDGVTKTATYTITVNAVSLVSVEVSDAKTAYYVGDTFVKPTVTATYSNGSTSDVTSSATFSGYNLSNAGNQTVTVSYTNGTTKTTSYSITVTAVSVVSISISGYKTTFTVGDTFSFGGTVTAHYNNGSSADVTSSATFSGYNMSSAGTQTVTVSYSGQSETYQIVVSSSSGSTDTQEGSATIASGAAEGWTASGTGTAYADGSIKFAASGVYIYKLDIFSGDVSTRMTKLEVTINGKINGSPAASNTYRVDALDSSNNSLGNETKSGEEVYTTTYSDQTFTISDTISGCTGIKIAYVTKGSGNWGVLGISWVAYYTSGGTVTSISVTTSKTFYAGETITKDDLYVSTNLGTRIASSDFSFTNNNYQFLYSDTNSGGSTKTKTFANAVTYQSFKASVTVNVGRKAYETPTGNTLVHTGSEFETAGIASSYTANQTATVDGITFKVDGYIYKSKLSLSESQTSAPGKVINTTPYPAGITDVTVTGASPDIQLSIDGSTWVDLSNATPSTVDYCFLKVFYKTTTQTNYVNISAINVTVKGAETAKNVSNYIMFEDTNNQCTSKFSVASGYFNSLSVSERETFMTSSDYVISFARERFEAWARHLGKTISYENGDYVITNERIISPINSVTSDNPAMIIVIISVVMGGIAIGGYFFIHKKKYQ